MKNQKFNVRPTTVKRYTEWLKLIVEKMNRAASPVPSGELREIATTDGFLRACVKLRYLERVGSNMNCSYMPLIRLKDVEPRLARNIADQMNQYNLDTKIKKFEQIEEVSSKKGFISNNSLDTFSVDQLVSELRKRGYSGNLQKIENLTV